PTGYPSNYEMLRIFGCVAYLHVNQGKLKPRAIKCILLRYPDGVKRDTNYEDSRKKVEFEVELQGSRVEPTVDRHTRENPGNEDEEQANEEPQHGKLCSGSREQDDMTAYAFAIVEEENTPARITFQEEINSSENDEWVLAMGEDMRIEGVQKARHKARLVAQGFTQQEEIDYNEVFSPMVRRTSIRVIFSWIACEDYELEQLDVKTTFLHGNLEETIYMRQPLGFEEGTSNKEFAPEFDMKELGSPKKILGMEIVRDKVFVPLGAHFNVSLKDCPSSVCDVERMNKEPGSARKILGIEIVNDRGSQTLKVPQLGYVRKLLNKFRVDNSKSVSVSLGAHFNVSLKECSSSVWDVKIMRKVPYAKVVDTLMYLIFLVYQSYHFIKEIVESKEIEVAKIGTKDNAAVAFTKVVRGLKFKYCMEILSVGAN
nr:retrotransposon protein, putative, Ty1-copia subclass [Tanacetum cinerariifolium]